MIVTPIGISPADGQFCGAALVALVIFAIGMPETAEREQTPVEVLR